MIRATLLTATLGLLALAAARGGSGLDLVAANPGFQPLNQLRVSGNACGPAALLSAYGFGSDRWQALGTAVPGETDRQRISHVIRGYGMRRSSHLDRPRWTRKSGMSLLDLTDIANEMRGGRWLPALHNEVLILKPRESPRKLLKRTHGRIAKSLKRGFPPVISLQRLAMRPSGADKAESWQIVHGHFLVVIALPAKLTKNATTLPIRYADPWGGRVLEGTLRIAPQTGYPALVADTPATMVGKRYLKPGETSIVTLSTILGAF